MDYALIAIATEKSDCSEKYRSDGRRTISVSCAGMQILTAHSAVSTRQAVKTSPQQQPALFRALKSRTHPAYSFQMQLERTNAAHYKKDVGTCD
eukprot:4362317-Pleurochrysis_carterae.AAC.1